MWSSEKTGLILCHGRAHTDPYVKSKLIPRDVNWILVDIDPESNPDVIADAWDTNDFVGKLGRNRYDYVVSLGCPVNLLESYTIYQWIKNIHYVLKPGGIFIWLNGIRQIAISFIFRYVSDPTNRIGHFVKAFHNNDPETVSIINDYLDNVSMIGFSKWGTGTDSLEAKKTIYLQKSINTS